MYVSTSWIRSNTLFEANVYGWLVKSDCSLNTHLNTFYHRTSDLKGFVSEHVHICVFVHSNIEYRFKNRCIRCRCLSDGVRPNHFYAAWLINHTGNDLNHGHGGGRWPKALAQSTVHAPSPLPLCGVSVCIAPSPVESIDSNDQLLILTRLDAGCVCNGWVGGEGKRVLPDLFITLSFTDGGNHRQVKPWIFQSKATVDG